MGRTGWLHWGQPNSLVNSGVHWMAVRDRPNSPVGRVRLVKRECSGVGEERPWLSGG